MVAWRAALMGDAALLLVDEPSLGLAPKISKGSVEALMADRHQGRRDGDRRAEPFACSRAGSRLIGLHAGKLKRDIGDLPVSGHAQAQPADAPPLEMEPRSDVDWFVVTSALSLASMYGLLGIGISIMWSSMGMINLAQGFIFAVAGYGAWWASKTSREHIGTNGCRRGRRASRRRWPAGSWSG